MALTENFRFTEAWGSRKAEFIQMTSSDTTTDTVVSRLVRVQAVTVVGTNGSATPSDITAGIGADEKTITITNPDADEYLIQCFGF